MPTWAAWHDFVPDTELEAAQLDAIIDNLKVLFPVGMYQYRAVSATTSENLVDGCWLECNGVSVLRATYPDLNTLLSGLSYPFGTADGTHFTLPDAQGRAPISMASGGHADVNGLGDSDGLTKASRSPKHNHTASLSINAASMTHGHGSVVVQSGAGSTVGGQTAPSSSTSAVGGTVGPGGTRPDDMIAYVVAGTLFIKAVS